MYQLTTFACDDPTYSCGTILKFLAFREWIWSGIFNQGTLDYVRDFDYRLRLVEY